MIKWLSDPPAARRSPHRHAQPRTTRLHAPRQRSRGAPDPARARRSPLRHAPPRRPRRTLRNSGQGSARAPKPGRRSPSRHAPPRHPRRTAPRQRSRWRLALLVRRTRTGRALRALAQPRARPKITIPARLTAQSTGPRSETVIMGRKSGERGTFAVRRSRVRGRGLTCRTGTMVTAPVPSAAPLAARRSQIAIMRAAGPRFRSAVLRPTCRHLGSAATRGTTPGPGSGLRAQGSPGSGLGLWSSGLRALPARGSGSGPPGSGVQGSGPPSPRLELSRLRARDQAELRPSGLSSRTGLSEPQVSHPG